MAFGEIMGRSKGSEGVERTREKGSEEVVVQEEVVSKKA